MSFDVDRRDFISAGASVIGVSAKRSFAMRSPNLGQSIDRHALVTRHNVSSYDVADIAQTMCLGNGEFAVNVDGTGVQTLAGSTLAHWAWSRFPLPKGYTQGDIPYTGTFERGHLTGPQIWPQQDAELGRWLYENPHTVNLGRLRLRLGTIIIGQDDIGGLSRKLDIWSGLHSSLYSVGGRPITVKSVVHPTRNLFSVLIGSPLLASGAVSLLLDFPYASAFDTPPTDYVGTWDQPNQHRSEIVTADPRQTIIRRVIDDLTYKVSIGTNGGSVTRVGQHAWELKAENGVQSLDVTIDYRRDESQLPDHGRTFVQTASESSRRYFHFWNSGGAIDLSGSTDSRWKELERRIVLSQYLMAAQSAGSLPPEESGLISQSWSGQFHMEMIWWHLAHYGLWNRWEMCEEALGFYHRAMPRAEALARQLNYRGLMWPKMTGPEGRNSVWVGNNILQWKQPHPIFLAELEYRLRPTASTLNKWKAIVFGTADFMADYPIKNELTGVFSLEPLLTANERYLGKNGVFELAYWRFGLEKAQEWRRRLGLPLNPQWDRVRRHLAPLPTQQDRTGRVYIESAEWTDNYSAAKAGGAPDPIGVYGMLPRLAGVDPQIASNTVRKVWQVWDWKRSNAWGWHFPWIAMAAARTSQPDIAVEALLFDAPANRYLKNGVNAKILEVGTDPRHTMPAYLPGNGALLYATAMMAAGWDGAPPGHAPGFPRNGRWSVRWEGLKRAV